MRSHDSRAESDVLFGKKCGLKTLMVGSGVNSLEDMRDWNAQGKSELVADYFANSLGDLNDVLGKFNL